MPIDERKAEARRTVCEITPTGSRDDINFQKKALDAYLRGDKYFTYHKKVFKTPAQLVVVDE
ncbi:MAG: hypothetical protein LLG05_14210 [Porphyromonadaceae bacterium]|nr:hypothetical protein [Porphyromonadaceae bacterium]